MTQDQVKSAFAVCNEAFHRYIGHATETHKLLSELSGEISLYDRSRVTEQRLRESDAQTRYREARNLLFTVLHEAVRPHAKSAM